MDQETSKLNTIQLKIAEPADDLEGIKQAGQILRNGGLVAFATETVYGLGANALDPEAVSRIYQAKGRPSDNPLIVHIGDQKDLTPLIASMPPKAEILMEQFWPGPLTLIFPRSGKVPDKVTGGLETVAVRMPAHPVSLAIIREAGVPIAAPSANKSGKPSPTRAEHVSHDLAGRVDMIVDSGPVKVGVESTVLDLTVEPPTILRPGGVTPEQLESVLGQRVLTDPALTGSTTDKPRAPGMKYTHYSPEAPVVLVEGRPEEIAVTINKLAKQYLDAGKKIGIMATSENVVEYCRGEVLNLGSRQEPATISANLFAVLREFDNRNVDIILAEAVENKGIGLAVMNRLRKSATSLVKAKGR